MLGSVSVGNQLEQSFIVVSADPSCYLLAPLIVMTEEVFTLEPELPESLCLLPFQHPHSQLSQMLPNNSELSKYISPLSSREFSRLLLSAQSS